MSLGSNIIALRKKRGISRKDLAKALNLPYTTLSSYETDQRLPSAKRLGEIANYFGVDIESVLAESGISGSFYLAQAALDKAKTNNPLDYVAVETEKEAALVFAYRRATADDKQIIDIITKKYLSTDRKADQKHPTNYAPKSYPMVTLGDKARVIVTRERLQNSLGRDPTPAEIATETGLDPEVIVAIGGISPSETMIQFLQYIEEAASQEELTTSPAFTTDEEPDKK